MLKWAVIFAVIAVIAGLFGFTGIAAGTAGIAKILFIVFPSISCARQCTTRMGILFSRTTYHGIGRQRVHNGAGRSPRPQPDFDAGLVGLWTLSSWRR